MKEQSEMATANGTGVDARPNSSPRPPVGTAPPGAPSHAETLLDIVREIRAWGSIGLFGAADQLEALAQEAARTPAEAMAHAMAPGLANAILDVAREQVAAEAAADTAPTLSPDKADPTPPAPDADERLDLIVRASWQIDALMDLIIDSASRRGDDASLSLAIRARDLGSAIMSAAGDPVHDVGDIHRTVRGAHYVSTGAAS